MSPGTGDVAGPLTGATVAERVVELLERGPRTRRELAGHVGGSRAAVVQAVSRLTLAGVVVDVGEAPRVPGEGGSVARLLAHRDGPYAAPDAPEPVAQASRTSGSDVGDVARRELELRDELLTALELGPAKPNELAEQLFRNKPETAHRLRALRAAGRVDRDPVTGAYQLARQPEVP